MGSILGDIKKLLGPDIEDDFDQEIIIHINSAISKLAQVGACDETARIASDLEQWEDIFQNAQSAIPMAKTYIYYKTRLGFDPPQNSFTIESFKTLADEELWRINDLVDRGVIGGKT